MSDRLDEPFDPFERRLADHVQSYSDQAVVPVDAAAIAHAVTSRRRSVATSPFRGVGWLLIGALLAAIAVGMLALNGGGPTLPAPSAPASAIAAASPPAASATPSPSPSEVASPSPTPSESPTPTPTATPTPTPAVGACQAADLSARITGWTGAAGHRIADVELTNDGPTCDLAPLQQPQLIDGADKVLIDGARPNADNTIRFKAGAKLTTEVQDDNYCGPTPKAPVTIGFVLAGGTRLDAEPVSPTDVMGVPPCNGPTLPGDIEMQPWKP